MTDAAAATVDPYPPVDEAKALVASLCAQFYTLGWVSGTGGGLSMRAAGGAVVMAPSGVQKERMTPDDMFVLNADDGSVRTPPTPRPPPAPAPKLSECAPLFMAAYEMRGAGAVAHSHSMWAVLATLLDEGASEFRCTHLEMIKGVAGHGYYGPLVVPIIENTARECELTGRLRDAIAAYPKSNAVLVRRHGVYVWGESWGAAKAQAESYDYLFEAAVRMRGLLGIDAAVVPAPDALRRLAGDVPAPDRILAAGLAAQRAAERWCHDFAPSLATRIEPTAAGLFDLYDLDDAVAALSEAPVALASGGSLVIEHTEALTAIDVNAGSEPNALTVNLAAATEIARQLRLRHIGGIIVVDFISMARVRDRDRLMEAFRGAVANDPAQTYIVPMSPLGLVEMTRERRGPGLEFDPS